MLCVWVEWTGVIPVKLWMFAPCLTGWAPQVHTHARTHRQKDLVRGGGYSLVAADGRQGPKEKLSWVLKSPDPQQERDACLSG